MQISIRDAIVPVPQGKTLFDALRELGVSAIELFVDLDSTTPTIPAPGGGKHSIKDAAALAALKAHLNAERIRVGAMLLGTDFSSEQADAHVQWAVRSIRAARELGAPTVRIDTATRNKNVTPDQARENFIRRIEQVLDQTADTGVDLGIENHGHISNNSKFLDGVFAAVGDQRLGMTLDTGNFYWYGYPLRELYQILEHFAPRAKHTHIKNINYPKDLVEKRREIGYEYGKYCCPLDEGNIDIGRVVQILKKAGYARDLCIENEALGKYPPEQRLGVLKRDAQALYRFAGERSGQT